MDFLQENRRAVILLLVGVFFAIFVYGYDREPESSAVAAHSGQAQATAAVLGSQPIMPEGYQREVVLRDPFLPPEASKEKGGDKGITTPATPAAGKGAVRQSPKKLVRPVLLGIASNGVDRQVVIVRLGEESRTLKVTEAIGEYRLVAIGENTATFEGPEGAVVLRQER